MIAVGSDHAGYHLKQAIMRHLDELGLAYKDYGTYTTESCHYPTFGKAVGVAVASGEAEKGILVCGSGVGISISANKVKGVRAVCCSDTYSARFSRMHNDTNIIAVGERIVGEGLALDIIDAWLNTEFEGGRHAQRVQMITEIENEQD